MEILVTVSYIVSADRDTVWDARTRRLTPEVHGWIEGRFPLETPFPGGSAAKRDRVCYQPIGGATNSSRCPSCGKWISNPQKPNFIPALERSCMLNGVELCPSCAWELEADCRAMGKEKE